MKCKNLNIFLLTTTLLILIKLNQTLRLSAMKGSDDFQLDDKEIEAMLKDPKFSNIAGDLNKLKSSRAQMAAAGAELKTLGVDVAGGKKDSATAKKEDASAKDLPKDLEMPMPALKTGLEKPNKKSASLENPEDLLSKLGGDAFKELGMEGKMPDMSGAAAQPQKKEEVKANPVDDKFKNIEFITKQQARLLLEILKQPSFFNMLPQEAQQIVKSVTDGFTFKTEENNKINDFIESSLVNTPNSQTFVDPDGIIGRKGILTILDPENGNSRFVWAVSNAKVLTFFQSQSFLTIVKLYRNSTLFIQDINATPCFLILNRKDKKDGSLLVCSTSTQEKEVWVQTIKANVGQDN